MYNGIGDPGLDFAVFRSSTIPYRTVVLVYYSFFQQPSYAALSPLDHPTMKLISSLTLVMATIGSVAMAHANSAIAEGNINNKPLLKKRGEQPAKCSVDDNPLLKKCEVRTALSNVHSNPTLPTDSVDDKTSLKKREVRAAKGNANDNQHLKRREDQAVEGNVGDKPFLMKRQAQPIKASIEDPSPKKDIKGAGALVGALGGSLLAPGFGSVAG
ncbi:hypothetical protein BJ085DRAFT_32345 [Dimargaris cristalligena]|uniref:Uncharacterized protein n=1 Tax=Dimargaris cristalligena TaxID=215637 RepID=A0A4P9ZNB2_9FUNG|nr:hypothetical protein BJ085DRAFT_32345 [Dimargaris cristalligena]|eukprot:RKP33800.1 hypothetical protein BJ085DRAFT_32345 [Dimargaris cristalligena]